MNKIFTKKYNCIPKEPNKTKKSASLLELFFDLVFVAFIGSFVHRTIHILENNGKHFTWFAFAFLVTTLISVIVIWRQFTNYSSRYEAENSFRHRIFTFLIMVGISIISTSLFIDFAKNSSSHGHADPFGNFNKIIIVTFPGYVLTLSTLGYLSLSTALAAQNKYEKKKQLLTSLSILGACAVALPSIIINVIFNTTFTRWLSLGIWSCGIIFWILFSWIASSNKIAANTPDNSLSHLKERTGIIFIVFIGESIVQIIHGTSEHLIDSPIETIFKLIMISVILFSWWWWFNDTINFPDLKNNPKSVSIYKESILFLLISLAFCAVGFSGMVKSPDDKYPKIMLAIGSAIWCISNSIIFVSLKDYNKKSKLIFLPVLRKFIYLMPLLLLPIFHIVIYDAVSNMIFLYITLCLSFVLVPLVIIIHKISKRSSHKYIDKYIKDHEAQEKEFFNKEISRHVDYGIHEEYKYKLNHYSQFIKD